MIRLSEMASEQELVPANSWETHIHVFEPEKYPYAATRAYTPAKATLDRYPASATECVNLVIVQSTVHGTDPTSLLQVLAAKVTEGGPPGLRRGIAVLDLEKYADEDLDRLHVAGVRGIRLHEVVWDFGSKPSDAEVANKLHYAASRVSRLNWVIDIYVHPKTWLSLVPTNDALPTSTKIIADHWACLRPGDEDTPECLAILNLLRRKRIYMKLSSTERQSLKRVDGVKAMRNLIDLLIEAGPDRLLYGSDWPHTALPGPRKGKTREQRLNDVENFRNVDLASHICLLRAWIQDEKIWQDMWVNTPSKLFA